MRLIWHLRRVLVCGVFLWTMIEAAGSTAAEPPSNQAEIEAIRKAAQAYLQAVEKGDHAAIKSFWTPEGDVLDEAGRRIKPASVAPENAPTAASESGITEQKIEKGHKLDIQVESIRLITSEVAIEDGLTHISPPPADRPASGRFTAVWVKRQGKWLIDSVRSSAAHIPHHQQRLQELDWMVGDWVEAGDASAIQMKCRWSADNNFLLRQIRIHPKDRDPHMVTQRIGWDPVARQLRSWIFDSNGGFGEGVWAREGDHWVINSKSTLPDGKQATGTTINSQAGENGFLWQSVDYMVDGQKMPDLRVKLVRQEETPKETKEETPKAQK
jgi:ketosteroid isomerase-like protein